MYFASMSNKPGTWMRSGSKGALPAYNEEHCLLQKHLYNLIKSDFRTNVLHGRSFP